MHNLLYKLKIATFPFSTFQLTPVSIQPELASQQPITLRHFICWFISIDYILYHYFQVKPETINHICDRFGSQARTKPFS
jgi:hypothetical protein